MFQCFPQMQPPPEAPRLSRFLDGPRSPAVRPEMAFASRRSCASGMVRKVDNDSLRLSASGGSPPNTTQGSATLHPPRRTKISARLAALSQPPATLDPTEEPISQ